MEKINGMVVDKQIENTNGVEITRYCLDKELALQIKYANEIMKEIAKCFDEFTINHDFNKLCEIRSKIDLYFSNENVSRVSNILKNNI